MLQLQNAMEENRCKVLQIDGRLEEILETSSYFVDRSQDVLEVLTARMSRLENNEKLLLRCLRKIDRPFSRIMTY